MSFIKRALHIESRHRVVLVTSPSSFPTMYFRLPTPPYSIVPVVQMTPLLPLGPAYIAAVLEKAGFDVKIVDLTFIDNKKFDADMVKKAVLKLKPDAVGLSALTWTIPSAYRLAKALKEEASDLPLVLGGPHVSALPQRTLEECPSLDAVTVGEAEHSFPALLELLFSKGICDEMKNIQGIMFRNGSKILGNIDPVYVENVDDIPFPARHLFDLRRYMQLSNTFKSQGHPVASMITSRGCPHSCIFCTRSNNGYKYRGRSPGNVVSEMQKLKELGFNEIQIIDDNFTENRQRVVEICEEIRERNLELNLSLPNGIRVDRVDEELLLTMYHAGFYSIHFGVESGDDDVLREIHKGTSLKQIIEAIQLVSKIGYQVLLFIVIGLPGSTMQSERNTLDFLREMQVPFTFSVCTPYPGSPLWEKVKDKINAIPWDRFDETRQQRPFYITENMTRRELEDCIRAATKFSSSESVV